MLNGQYTVHVQFVLSVEKCEIQNLYSIIDILHQQYYRKTTKISSKSIITRMKIISVLLLLATSQVTSFSLTPKNDKPLFNNPLKTLLKAQDVTKDLSKKSFATILGSFLLLSSNLSPILPGGDAIALSGGSRVVGEIAGSGIVFKDTLTVESFDDPKVQGVTLYISNFQRPLNERLQKDFFNDPSFASVSCAKTGPISVADNIVTGKTGEEVFEESKSLLFKQLRVQVRSSSFTLLTFL